VLLIAQVAPQEVEAAAVPLMYALSLLAFLSFIILWGLRVCSVDWVTALLRWFQKHTPSLPVVGNVFGDLAGGLATGIEDTVGASLSYAAGKFEQGAVFWFHGANSLVMYLGDSLAWDFGEVTHGFRVLTDSYIPWAVKQGREIVYKGIDDIGKITDHITRAVEQATSTSIDGIERELAKIRGDLGNTRSGAATAGRAGAIPVAVPLGNELTELQKYIRDVLSKQLGGVAAAEATGAHALAIAATLEHEWPYYKSTNWRNLGKWLNKVPVKTLEGLLNDLLNVVVLVDICEAIVLLEDGLKPFQPVLTKFVGVVDGALCHGDYAKPGTLAVPALFTPTSAAVVLYTKVAA
jgi:hypothetical protein